MSLRSFPTRSLRLLLGVVALILVAACTDLRLDGDEQLRCASNADCPAGLLCATALERCVDEAIVAEIPIAVAGDAVIDAARISRVEGFARATVTVTFTKTPVAVSALVDGRLSIACADDETGPLTQRCSFDARDFPDEADGGYDVVVVASDGAGNEARARARVELDTTAPDLAPDSVVVRYEPVEAGFVREPSALGPTTRALVQLSLTEATATPPTLQLTEGDVVIAGLVRDEARSAGPLQVFSLEGDQLDGLADGAYPLVLAVADDVGNVANLDPGPPLVIDQTAPAAADVDAAERLVFRRVPWGTRAAPTPTFSLTGEAGAAEPGALVVVTTGADLSSSLLGTATADVDGAFSPGG